ncbi:hypothetical protein [Pararobbsia silviterrae]|uniref:Uncharacterized protein n=1 Tax=Pararobbsia silviterrae TaxID=1792498 RepID=A0A494YA11_9BURK|nr:hypothetical protein [Pararobbsia silviterrae]RKP59216.1 hypothetical protein D7S86_04795 [Pararobbsia silviterrae]
MPTFLAIVAIAFVTLAWLSIREQRRETSKRELRRRTRAFAQTSAACHYIQEINRTRAFPLAPTANLRVVDGEFSLLFEHCTQYEVINARVARLRARRSEPGARSRAPIRVRSGDGSSELAHPVGGGELFLTNQRLVFMSPARSTNIRLGDVVGIRGNAETLSIHMARRRRPYHFSVQNPALWALLAKMMSSQTPATPMLPDGMRLHAAPTGVPGEIHLEATHTRR